MTLGVLSTSGTDAQVRELRNVRPAAGYIGRFNRLGRRWVNSGLLWLTQIEIIRFTTGGFRGSPWKVAHCTAVVYVASTEPLKVVVCGRYDNARQSPPNQNSDKKNPHKKPNGVSPPRWQLKNDRPLEYCCIQPPISDLPVFSPS